MSGTSSRTNTWEFARLGFSAPERELTLRLAPPDSHSTTSLIPTLLSGGRTPSISSSDGSASEQNIVHSPPHKSQPRRGISSHAQQLFKALGLSVGFNLFAKRLGWPVTERRKVVMKKNRLFAILRCVVHLVPLSAAIALLVLNGTNNYIGGELTGPDGQDSQKLAALLFVAKVHELFMLASLGAILITYIRKELVFGDGVPFGAVFSATQFKDLTFLWSPELWGTVLYEWEQARKKWFFVCLLVLCSIAGLTVGPSTGILMRPRLDEWPAGGTTFWLNGTKLSLQPELMEAPTNISHCALDTGDLSCPAGGWQVLNEGYFPYWKLFRGMGLIPQSLYMPGRLSIRQFSLRTRNVRNERTSLLWANAFTLATVSPSFVADALVDLERFWINAAANADIGNFKFRRDVSFSTDAAQPLVLSRCYATTYAVGKRIDLQFPSFRNVTLTGGQESAAQYESFAIIDEWLQVNDTRISSKIKSRLDNDDHPALYWIDDIDIVNKTQSSITVVATIPRSDAGPAAYHACSIDSRFANATLKSARSAIAHVLSAPAGYDDTGTFKHTYPRVKLSAKWAAYLDPIISTFPSNSTNTPSTVFSTLASTAGLWTNTTSLATSEWYPIITENILATLVANGLSRANYNASLVGTLRGLDSPRDPWSLGAWVSQILPSSGRLGSGGAAFDVPPAVQALATQFELRVRILGYAYSATGATQIAAMIALTLYVLLVLCHVAYAAATGWCSASWGSPSEVTALAMNSVPTERLANTGAGIETIDVFRERVRVRLKDGRAQMVFWDTEGGGGLEKGVAYA